MGSWRWTPGVRVAPPRADDKSRLAIRPYPKYLEEEFVMKSGRKALLRPIRPEDEPEHHAFISKLTPEDIRFRFFGSIRELPHSEMARLTQIDYDREMAFIATAPGEGGKPETLGVVRTVTDPNNEEAEYAIVVRSDLKGEGLGRKMMDKMIDYCRARGTKYYVGQVLRENRSMLGLPSLSASPSTAYRTRTTSGKRGCSSIPDGRGGRETALTRQAAPRRERHLDARELAVLGRYLPSAPPTGRCRSRRSKRCSTPDAGRGRSWA